MSGSQIAHYFRDKRDLTRQVIASRRADVVAFHTQSSLGALDTLEDLRAWAAACIADIDAVYRRGGCVYGSLVGELIDSDDEVRDDLAVGYDQWLDLFEAGLAAMRHRGDLRPRPIRDTWRHRWSSRTKAVRCSPMSPETQNRCGLP